MSAVSTINRYLLPGFAFKAVVIGGGYATGRELVEFFMPTGPVGGLWGMLLAMAMWSVICAITFRFAYAVGATDYQGFFRPLLGRFDIAFEIIYFGFLILVLSVFGSAAGAIGAIYRSRGCGVHIGWGPSGWFTEAKLAGGGAVADMGIHAIDTLRFVLGEPKAIAVSARTARRFISGDVEDTASIRIDWDSGGWSEVEAGWWQPFADGLESSLRLYGERGTATLFPTAVVKGAGSEAAETLAGPVVKKGDHCDPLIYAAQIAHMVAVVNGAPSLLDTCGPAAVAIMEAAYRSAASGKTEEVSS